MTTGISTKAEEELYRSVRRHIIKLNFNRRKLTQFWLSVQQTCPPISTEAVKVLLHFSSLYICEVGFSALVGVKNQISKQAAIVEVLAPENNSH
jgi:hypothetical protein